MKLTCFECGREFSAKNALSKHISSFHNAEKYYDKWIKKEGEDECEICGGKNIFISIGKGYKNGCCRKHIIQINHNNIEKAIMAKYGVKSSLSFEKNRIGGMMTKYGVKNPGQLKSIQSKIKNTNLKKYGVENPFQSEIVKEKIKNTNLKKYGVKYPTQSYEIREKIKESFRKNYNCEYALQNPIFFKKQQEYSRYARKFMNTEIYYRSSYEFDFLYKYFSKTKIINGKSIKYFFNGKNRIYYPDFFLEEFNLIVEIKSSHLVKKDYMALVEKEKAIRERGYNFIMIVDKDYTEFNKIIA